jgi:hypothetical protein
MPTITLTDQQLGALMLALDEHAASKAALARAWTGPNRDYWNREIATLQELESALFGQPARPFDRIVPADAPIVPIDSDEYRETALDAGLPGPMCEACGERPALWQSIRQGWYGHRFCQRCADTHKQADIK